MFPIKYQYWIPIGSIILKEFSIERHNFRNIGFILNIFATKYLYCRKFGFTMKISATISFCNAMQSICIFVQKRVVIEVIPPNKSPNDTPKCRRNIYFWPFLYFWPFKWIATLFLCIKIACCRVLYHLFNFIPSFLSILHNTRMHEVVRPYKWWKNHLQWLYRWIYIKVFKVIYKNFLSKT